ncbi:piggyBac transposable element-derived protein 3-like [Calliphora vicina]|uniref:piggyBac transposable element-derived protein 3-like n=1 Tax=Calliphora vicina TaxID=7373 RepID=UPI00325B8E10
MTTRRRYGYLTLEEATQYLEELLSDDSQENIIEQVVIEPPRANYLPSDEDSGDEDGGGLPQNLPKALLIQPCEITIRKSGSCGDDDQENAEDMENVLLEQTLQDVINNSSDNLNIDCLRSNATTPLNVKSSAESPKRKAVENKIKTQSKVPRVQHFDSASGSTKKPRPSKCKKSKYAKRLQSETIQWVEDEDVWCQRIFPEPDFSDCTDLPPYVQFEKFFDDELVQMLCNESNSYAVYSGQENPKISMNEMRVFLGILIVTGYASVPSKRDYWTNESDLKNELVSDSMRRNRFDTIFRNIHFIDNAKQQGDDKIWKLRPYTDALKTRFLKHFHPEQCLSYDESMIEYYGRHSCKQFIRGKPLRFGYKMWSLNTPLGYLINFEMYQGSNPRLKPEYYTRYGKNITPLFCMLDEFDENVKQLEFSIHFDNLFTTVNALVGLKQRGYHGTGTIRENCIPKSCPLPLKDVLKKQQRGHIESIKMVSPAIKITKWVDNAVVSVASTIHGKVPITKIARFSRTHKKRIMVPLPHAINEYNKNMGGTDRMDQNVNAYRIGARGKKWWFSIFTWLVDVSIQNAWILHRKAGGSMSQLSFRRSIATRYCKSYGSNKPPQSYRRLATDEQEYSTRYDGVNHFVVETKDKKRRRCAGLNCLSHPTSMCKKCNFSSLVLVVSLLVFDDCILEWENGMLNLREHKHISASINLLLHNSNKNNYDNNNSKTAKNNKSKRTTNNIDKN